MVMVSDTTLVTEDIDYHEKDSILLFQDLDMKTISAKVQPYSVVYQLKQTRDKRKSLVSTTPYINPNNVGGEVLGWIDNSLIKDIGLGLHVGVPTIPRYTLQATFSEDIAPRIGEILDRSKYLGEQYPTIKYAPVISYSTKDTLIAYRVQIPQSVLDNSDSYILNVNGGQINHSDFRSMSKNMKAINVIFVFEGKEQTISQFPQIVNAIQGMQPLFEQPDDEYTYKFSAVLTFDDTNRLIKPSATELSPTYSTMINFLTEKANNKSALSPLKLPRTWGGLRKAMEMIENHKHETNLIVLIGEKGHANESLDIELASKLSRYNCRILGFQVYSGDDNIYNNFVLDIEGMINNYATDMLTTKGEVLVNNGQKRRSNSYKEVPGAKNSFRLDYPSNSITQGGVLFPQKGQLLPLDILTNNVDTLIQQIRTDNQDVISNMSKAFITVGNNRAKYESLFKKQYRMDPRSTPLRKFASAFNVKPLGWSFTSGIIYLNDRENKNVDYRLMLSEHEAKALKEFIGGLSLYEVDFKYKAKDRKKSQNLCNCPDDDLFIQVNMNGNMSGNIQTFTPEEEDLFVNREYDNTSKIRKYLVNYYKDILKEFKIFSCKDKELKTMTLAEAHLRITGIPASDDRLNHIRMKDLRNKKIVTDKMLDELIGYFKENKEFLTKSEQFESNGGIYYWVNRNLLP